MASEIVLMALQEKIDTDNFCPNCGHEYAHKLAYAVPVKTVVALLNAEAEKGDFPK